MKTLLIFIIFGLGLFAKDTYSIQVISAHNKTSVTEGFMQKVRATGLPYFEEEFKGDYKVYVGEFKDKEVASRALKNIQKDVSADAFVCEQGKSQTAEQKMQAAIVFAKARTLKKMDTTKVQEKILKRVEPIKVTVLEPKVVIVKKTPRVKIKKKKEKYCKDSKSILREDEIAKALAFYSNSSYYKFSKH